VLTFVGNFVGSFVEFCGFSAEAFDKVTDEVSDKDNGNATFATAFNESTHP
jgi:hypothetical protein